METLKTGRDSTIMLQYNKTPQKQKPPIGGMFVGLARYLIPTWSSKYPLLLHKIG